MSGDEYDVTQKGNKVEGNLAGRDVSISTTHNYYGHGRLTSMQRLIAQYHEEMKQNSSFRHFIETLQHYLDSVDTDQKIVGLEAKMKQGGREQEINEAMRQKELFAKRLQKHQFSETAQKIYALVLGRIHVAFKAEIRPLILVNAPHEQVDAAIVKNVLSPIFEELEANPLDVTFQELSGMLHFLVGNCHIRWV
ncbi:ABC-three component system protein [Corallococcus exiguus]|uniref:ABC-three component system protein n=1 Tax=Corallococcus exiguus TaxID=83462 RepID=UPI00156078A1|nr:ABC-three component system protein [Corallococcus exiguus]NRD58879.1 hypothetical protein [Corallococcus exiguus]